MAGSADIYVSFSADVGGLEAALALTKQNVAAMTRELNTLAKEMRTTGATADSDLGSRMKALGAQIAGTKTQARDIAGQMGGVNTAMHETAAVGAHGGTGIGFYLRELHALSDEFGSGRTRQGMGTLSNLVFTFLQGQQALIPYAVAIGALAAAFGYLGYQAYAAAAAVRSIVLDAAVNEFSITEEAAAKLRDSIERLANVGATAAAEIVKPFLALGPVGEIVAQLTSPHLTDLAMMMGKTIPDAAAAVQKYFADLSGEGSKLVHSSVLVTEATKQQYDAFVAAGDKGGAYGVIIDIISARLTSHEDKAKLAKAATIDHAAALGDAALAGGDMAASTAHLGEATDEANGKITQLSGELATLRGQLQGAASGARKMAQALDAGMEMALKVDRVTGEIKATNGEIARLEAGIAAAGDKANASGDTMSRALDIARDHLKKLQDEASGGLLGGAGLERVRRENEELANTFKGSPTDLLKQQLGNVQGVANDPTKDAHQREDAEHEASTLIRQIRDAEFEDAKAKDDQRATLAGKNSAAVVAIRQQEVARATAIYGAGSRQQQAALEQLARAQERGAERGATAGAKAAKDELGASLGSLQEQIRAEEDKTKATLDHLNAEVKLKQTTEPEKAKAAIAALTAERVAVEALYAREAELAGLSLTKKQEIATRERTFQDSIALQIQEAQEKSAEATQKAWTTSTNEIEKGFNSQLRGLLEGTTTWGSAAKKILEDWAIEGIEAIEKLAVNFLLQQTVMNNAASAGAALRLAADQTASSGGIAALIANAIRAITVDAQQTAAGVAAWFAPIIGPAAPAAGAAAGASVLALASFDIGAWNVPKDQVAMIHRGELVATSSQADALRSLPGILAANGGGAGGGGGRAVSIAPTTHMHIHSMDSATVASTLMQNRGAVMQTINQAVRDGAHLGMKRLNR